MKTFQLKSIGLFARFGLVALAAAMVTGCAGLQGAPSIRDDGLSPRFTTLQAADRIEPVLKEVTLLIDAGAISDNVTDDIAQYGPDVQALLAAYFKATAACVVIDGALQTDIATADVCKKSVLLGIYEQLDGQMWAWALQAGLDTDAGKLIAGARLIVSLSTKPASGDIITGYRKDPDVPLDQFLARQAQLKVTLEALLSAAAKHAAAGKAATK